MQIDDREGLRQVEHDVVEGTKCSVAVGTLACLGRAALFDKIRSYS